MQTSMLLLPVCLVSLMAQDPHISGLYLLNDVAIMLPRGKRAVNWQTILWDKDTLSDFEMMLCARLASALVVAKLLPAGKHATRPSHGVCRQ